MDNRVLLQVNQRLFQVVHGVHHEIVAGCADADRIIARLFQCQVREEVHEPLEHADPVLRTVPRVPHQRDVLLFDTSLVIRVAHLIPTGEVAKGKGEVVPLPQHVMNLPAEHTRYILVNQTGAQVGEQRGVSQRHDPYVLHLAFHGPGRRVRHPHSGYRGDVLVPLDVRKYLAHVVRPVKVLAQLHQIAARRRAEVVPLVQPVVDLERRRAFIP